MADRDPLAPPEPRRGFGPERLQKSGMIKNPPLYPESGGFYDSRVIGGQPGVGLKRRPGAVTEK